MALVFLAGFLAFVVLFTLAAVQGTRLAGRIMGERINALHQAADIILQTECIPAAWLEALPRDRREQWQRRQKRRALRRLGKLRTYMQDTPSISDVASREYILAELDRIRARWQASDPDLIIVMPAMPAHTPAESKE